MTLLTIFYWVLILLIIVGTLAPPEWAYPRANAIITLILFIIIGLKLLKPTW
jgi:hypothetical protein